MDKYVSFETARKSKKLIRLESDILDEKILNHKDDADKAKNYFIQSYADGNYMSLSGMLYLMTLFLTSEQIEYTFEHGKWLIENKEGE